MKIITNKYGMIETLNASGDEGSDWEPADLSSDEEQEAHIFDDDTKESKEKVSRKRKKSKAMGMGRFQAGFEFDNTQNDYSSEDEDTKQRRDSNWVTGLTDQLKAKKRDWASVDEKIAKVRKANKTSSNEQKDKTSGSENDSDDSEDDDDDEDDSGPEDKLKGKSWNRKTLPISYTKNDDDKKPSHGDDVDEEGDELVRYAEVIDATGTTLEERSFDPLHLSRPIRKALDVMNYHTPTPIQVHTIPVALAGRDICACAVTGSGKTLAFLAPAIERLQAQRTCKGGISRGTKVLVLVPTRELAVQVYQVARRLTQFVPGVSAVVAAGGLDIKAQEASLRRNPDIVIATPGRLIDLLHNAAGFSLHEIQILILDEADRMLDEFFATQLAEVVKLCGGNKHKRQTMLFSATMTEKVRDLAAVSLSNPVKIFVDTNKTTAKGLVQEFVRIRAGRGESDREAILAALVTRTFSERVIVFVQTKKQAHRLHVVLGLIGIKVGELHSTLSQAQRLEALSKFGAGDIDVLVATDLASRGLDIPDVRTIINFTLPNTLQHYIHRVGRTARAGKTGSAVSLVGDSERNLLKQIVKYAHMNREKSKNVKDVGLQCRVVAPEVVVKFRTKLDRLEDQVVEILEMEATERSIRSAENKANRWEKQIDGKDDNEERRSWFQSKKEREAERMTMRLDNPLGLEANAKPDAIMAALKVKRGNPKKPKHRDMDDNTARVQRELEKSQKFSARFVKKKGGPGTVATDPASKSKRKSAFDKDVSIGAKQPRGQQNSTKRFGKNSKRALKPKVTRSKKTENAKKNRRRKR